MKKAMMHAAVGILAAAILCAPVAASAATYPRLPPVSEAKYTNVIDVSHYESVSSWAALRQNTSIIYIKATEGTGYTDPTVDKWATGAKNNGVDFGLYHYFHPSTVANAIQQADYFVSVIGQYAYSCIPAIDVEEDDGQTAAQITACVNAFRAEVTRLTGHDCMIYVSAGRIDEYFTSALNPAPLWVADYASPYVDGARKISSLFGAWTMWQYTESGTQPGIYNTVDKNKATTGVLLSQANAPAASASQSETTSAKTSDYYVVSSLPQAANSRAGTDFYIRDRYGNRIGSHQIDAGDPIIILSVDYSTQLAEVLYPNYAAGGWYHGYITNNEAYLHNIGYNEWQNGSTKELVYDVGGDRIGSIDPHEKATVLDRSGSTTKVLYGTSKGTETKSGYVRYPGR